VYWNCSGLTLLFSSHAPTSAVIAAWKDYMIKLLPNSYNLLELENNNINDIAIANSHIRAKMK
jgi:hypothetical protein